MDLLGGFMFGNINEAGELENDELIDKNSCAYLSRLGIAHELTGIEEGDVHGDEEDCAPRTPEQAGAVDYADINEVAEDEEQKEKHYQLGMKYMDTSKVSAMDDDNYDDDEPVAMTSVATNSTSHDPPQVVPSTDDFDQPSIDDTLNEEQKREQIIAIVKELFPCYKPDSLLRCSVLFPPKPSSVPRPWQDVKKPQKRRKQLKDDESCSPKRLNLGKTPPPEMIASDDEEKFAATSQFTDDRAQSSSTKSGRKSAQSSKPISASHWRHGPAKLWYDQLGVPEDGRGFDYGFKLKENSQQDSAPLTDEEDEGKPPSVIEDPVPLEAFSMLANKSWEDDINYDTPAHTGPMKFAIDGQWVTPSDPVYHWQTNTQLSSNSMDKVEKTEDGHVYSILPAENYNLIHGRWENDIIYDCDAMSHIPQPRPLQLDCFDPNIVVGIVEESESIESAEKEGRKETKGRSKSAANKSSRGDGNQMLSLNQQKNLFNISHDDYYNPRHTTGDNVMAGTGQIVQHSIPACQLHPLWFPTHYKTHHLRNFHRPKFGRLVDQSAGSCPIYNLVKHISRKEKGREREVIDSGGGEVFFMRTSEDLSACDGHVILCEYSEEYPPHLMNIGMATKIRNYYKRPERQVKDHAPTMEYGDTTYVQNKINYLLGNLKPGQVLQCFDNNLFRASIYHHLLPETDFLIIKAEDKLFIRKVSDIFTVGQECPKMVIPGPNSKADKEFQKNYLSVFLYRLFIESEESDDPLMEPHTIKMEWVRQAFPNLHENGVRKRLKLMADFQRVGSESGCWILRRDVRLPSEEELRAMVTPEQVCCWACMLAAEQRLKDAGYGGKSLFAEEDEEDDGKLDDEVLCAPWNTTKAFVEAMKGKHQLQVTGPADPTGCGEGFSYTKMPKITPGKEDSVAMPAKKSGTDADLRKLKLKHAKNVLREFGVSEEEISKMKRWQVIDMVRTMSTEAAKAGGGGSFKFARGGRFSQLEAQERHRQECQRIFNLQNQILASKEVLSTDEESSSGAGESDDELGKNLENMLHGKNSHQQLSHEQEEMEREELKKLLAEDKKPVSSRVASPAIDEDTSSVKSFTSSRLFPTQVGNKLVISRTFNTDDREFVRTEVVTNPAVIDAYMKIAGNKQLKLMFAGQDEQARENMRKERRRIQDRLRRIKKEKVTKKPKKEKPKSAAAIKMKCGACGQHGHMKTNKNCPMFVKDPTTVVDTTPTTFNIAMTAEEEAAQQENLLSQDELITKVEGTKISFGKALIDHANDMRKKALLLKFPKDKLHRRNRQGDMEYLTEGPVKQAKRRRTSPEVLLTSTLDEILTKLKNMPESVAFQKPVNSKSVPDYYTVIKFPMDLQTMKNYLKTHYYSSREQFLEHFNLIVTNCITYNGFEHELTQNAQRLLEVCIQEIKKREEELAMIEQQINPALDNNAHVALSYRLEMVVNRMKNVPNSQPFHHPVQEKKLPTYYKVITSPMDLETMRKKCKMHRYRSRQDFLKDVTQIVHNSTKFNGSESVFTKTTEAMKEVSLEALDENAVEFEQLEGRILLASQQMAEAQGDGSLLPGSGNSTPKMGGLEMSEDMTDIDVETMDTLLEDLRTSPQHSSDDDSLASDSDNEMSTVGTPSSLPIDASSQMSHSPLPASQSSPSSSSSSSSSSSEESELEDD